MVERVSMFLGGIEFQGKQCTHDVGSIEDEVR